MARPSFLIGAALTAGAFIAGGLVAGILPGEATPFDVASSGTEGNAAATTAGSSVDSCTLITSAEAKAALGAEVSQVPNPAQCTYVALDGTERAVSVTVPDYPGGRRGFAAGVDQAAKAFEGTSQPIDTADEGYAILSELVAEGLARRDDTYVVVVLVNPSGTAAHQVEQLTGLLNSAMGRL